MTDKENNWIQLFFEDFCESHKEKTFSEQVTSFYNKTNIDEIYEFFMNKCFYDRVPEQISSCIEDENKKSSVCNTFTSDQMIEILKREGMSETYATNLVQDFIYNGLIFDDEEKFLESVTDVERYRLIGFSGEQSIILHMFPLDSGYIVEIKSGDVIIPIDKYAQIVNKYQELLSKENRHIKRIYDLNQKIYRMKEIILRFGKH
jgi:hypothetical protein